MKIIKFCFLLTIICGFLAIPVFGLDLEWDFLASTSLLGWQSASPDTKIIQSEGLTATSGKSMIYLASPGLMCFAEDNDLLTIKMQADASGQGAIYFNTSFEQTFDGRKSVPFQVKAGGLRTYYINMKNQNPLWSGRIIQIIINPGQSSNVRIIYAGLSKSNLYTSIISGIQEFFGPHGRVEIGSTINNMQASTFLGVSINTYAYYLVTLIALLSLIIYFALTKDLRKGWENTGKAVLLAMLLCWGLLEVNNLFNQASQGINDFTLFFGKSLDEKNAQVNPPVPMLYDIIRFAANIIPENSSYKFMTTDGFASGKANYYLYPRVQSDNNPEYIIRYNAKESADLNKYKLVSAVPGGEIYQKIK